MTDSTRPVAIETLLSHRAWVRGLAWSLVRDAHLVDEVEQETWLRALRSPPHEDAAARRWLATVVRNVVRNRFRSSSRRAHHEGAVVPRTASPGAGDVVARADSQQRLVSIVMALDDPARSTLLLRFFDGFSPREVASRMGVPVETVRTRTRRALNRVRADLEGKTGGRRAAFGLLAPLLVDASRPFGVGSGVAAGAGAAATATTTGATIMAAATQNTALLVAAVCVLGVGVFTFLASDDPARDSARPEADATSERSPTPGSDRGARRRVLAGRAGRGVASRVPVDAGASTPQARVTVRLADGRAATATAVVIDAGAEDPFLLRTDANGVVTTPAADHGRMIVVAAIGTPARAAELPAGTGGIAVELSPGVELAGVVRVNGGPPGEVLRLHVNLEDASVRGSAASPAVWDLLRSDGTSGVRVPFDCDPSGSFHLQGFEAGQKLWLVAPEGYRIGVAAARGMDVAVPARGVVVELRKLPRVRGRVLDESGRPVARALLMLRWSDGSGTGAAQRRASDDGRFDVPLPAWGLEDVTLRPSDPESDAGLTIDVAPTGFDLGDLVLPGDRIVRLRIVDPAGEAVVGAVVRTTVHVLRSDARGELSVVIPRTSKVVLVAAAAFHPTDHEIPQSLVGTQTVTLRPATRLTMSVTGAGEALLGRLRIILSRERGERLFGVGLPSADRLADGAAGPVDVQTSRFHDGTFRTMVAYDVGSGSVVVDAIRTEALFTMTLVDDLGFVHTRRQMRLPATRRVNVELSVAEGGRPFTGRVVDAVGAPIPGARLGVAAPYVVGGPVVGTLWIRADADGLFTLPVVHAPRLRMLVRADGYMPWSRSDVASGVTVRMTKARSVIVRLKDPSGNPVVASSVFTRLVLEWSAGVGRWEADVVSDGVYRLAFLQDQDTIKIAVIVAGDVHVFELDPRLPEHEFTVGEPK